MYVVGQQLPRPRTNLIGLTIIFSLLPFVDDHGNYRYWPLRSSINHCGEFNKWLGCAITTYLGATGLSPSPSLMGRSDILQPFPFGSWYVLGPILLTHKSDYNRLDYCRISSVAAATSSLRSPHLESLGGRGGAASGITQFPLIVLLQIRLTINSRMRQPHPWRSLACTPGIRSAITRWLLLLLNTSLLSRAQMRPEFTLQGERRVGALPEFMKETEETLEAYVCPRKQSSSVAAC